MQNLDGFVPKSSGAGAFPQTSPDLTGASLQMVLCFVPSTVPVFTPRNMDTLQSMTNLLILSHTFDAERSINTSFGFGIQIWVWAARHGQFSGLQLELIICCNMTSAIFWCVCVLAKPLPADRDPLAVYANDELKLSEIDVYGFDYDYTVACYNDSLNQFIYDKARANLMQYNKACFWIHIYLFW